MGIWTGQSGGFVGYWDEVVLALALAKWEEEKEKKTAVQRDSPTPSLGGLHSLWGRREWGECTAGIVPSDAAGKRLQTSAPSPSSVFLTRTLPSLKWVTTYPHTPPASNLSRSEAETSEVRNFLISFIN